MRKKALISGLALGLAIGVSPGAASGASPGLAVSVEPAASPKSAASLESAVASGSGVAPGGPESEMPAGLAVGSAGAKVTLVTGEHLIVRKNRAGEYAAQGVKGAGTFLTRKAGGRSYLFPVRLAGLVGSGVVDQRLFDLGELVAAQRAGRTPLLVEYSSAAQFSRASFSPGLSPRRLPVVNSVALKATPASWPSLMRSVKVGQIKKIWLDGGVHPLLEQSVPQIGAHSAWAKGLTGKGVRVAILDSGIDASRPDLAGRIAESKNFTEDADVSDGVGHGTHVASIAGGTGKASKGKRRGVAPDANLVVGKVCGARGCELSDIIAGMEWAATRAKVVNISLGGGPTDGKDPLSLAINRVTAKTGALFVVAAGNDGEYGPSTVSSPGTADAALTVGSVTKADELSVFSSKGPRYGDDAIKPDLTAPGDRIAAARATGTWDALAVGKWYAEASGTSMAAPHVAGAAAILAQQHPTWKADRLKAALMGTSLPGKAHDGKVISVFDQGAGRLDVAHAASQQMNATPGSLSFGIARFSHSDDQPMHRLVTYRNDSSRPVTLTLSLEGRYPQGLFRLGASTLTVPAGGRAKLAVTANTSAPGADGLFGGWVVARGDDGSIVRTAFGVNKEVPTHVQTFTVLGRDGKPVGGTDAEGYPLAAVGLVDVITGRSYYVEPSKNGTCRVRLPDGTYVIDATAGTADWKEVTGMFDMGRSFSASKTTVLDARKGNQINFGSPRKDAFLSWQSVGMARILRNSESPYQHYYTGVGTFQTPDEPSDRKVYVTPTRTSSKDAFGWVNAVWAKPAIGEHGTYYDNSPYVYDKLDSWPGQIPANLNFPYRAGEYARVDTGYSSSSRQPEWALPWLYPAVRLNRQDHLVALFIPAIGMKLPFRRAEYFSGGTTRRWASTFESYSDNFYNYLETGQDKLARSYRAGKGYENSWNVGVHGPGFPRRLAYGNGQGPAGHWAYRDGDTIDLTIPLFNDSHADRGGLSYVKTQVTSLYYNGKLVRRATAPYQQVFRVPGNTGSYRLDTTATRPPSRTSTSVSASWTFPSARTTIGKETPLPLLAVRFSPKLSIENKAAGGRELDIPVFVQRQAGRALATSLDLEASFDDGKTWSPVSVTRTGIDTFKARLRNPSKGFVSLRAKASDATGSEVTQTITRAYELK